MEEDSINSLLINKQPCNFTASAGGSGGAVSAALHTSWKTRCSSPHWSLIGSDAEEKNRQVGNF